MARKMKKAEGEAQGEIDRETGKKVIANVEARNVCIQDGFSNLFELEMEKARLEEEHLKDVKDRIKKCRKNISADTGIDATDIRLMYAIFKREQIAGAMEDENDRDRILDNLREVFSALQKGDMLDFVAVLEQEAA